MPIEEFNGCQCIVRLALSPAEIPILLMKHARAYPHAEKVEETGQTLIEGNFEPKASADFVQRVCEWGRGHRLIGRIKAFEAANIATVFRKAFAMVDPADAVTHIQKIPYLGQSFASKHLRFLKPGEAVIFDSVIRRRLGYPETAAGYAEFLRDCQIMRERISPAVTRECGMPLRVCDIEAAIFAKLLGF